MNGKRLSIRLNMDRLNHKKAFEILSVLPPGRKSEYVVNAIIRASDTDEVLELVRQVLHEDSTKDTQSDSSNNDGIDNVVVDYLKTL